MTPQVKVPAIPGLRLSAVGAAVGILMIVGGVAGHSSGTASQRQTASTNSVATAATGVLVQVPLQKTALSRTVTVQPTEIHQPMAAKPRVIPGPTEPHKAQKSQQSQRPPVKPGPGGGGAGFYPHCPEALTPGPPPNQRARPGQYSPFDHDQDGKSCEG